MDDHSVVAKVRESLTSFFRRKQAHQEVAPRLFGCAKNPYGAFQFKVQLWPGASFEIRASSNLLVWETIFVGDSPSGELDYVDSEARLHNHRFYRVIAGRLASDNVIGYATIMSPPGFALIANPLQATDNRVPALFQSVPNGTSLHKFDHNTFKLLDNSFRDGKWSNPLETLVPGEGAILGNPTSEYRPITFVGEVLQGKLYTSLQSGFSLRSSQVPQSGRLHLDLGFPAGADDVIHLFDSDQQKYIIMEYDEARWKTNPPIVAIGESFWVGKNQPGNWVREFHIQ